MSPMMIGALGSAVGLLIAFVANHFALPWVLERQRKYSSRPGAFPAPNPSMTKMAYRILFPIVFAVVGWVGATRLFGGTL